VPDQSNDKSQTCARPALGARARCIDDIDALAEAVAADARPGDHVLVMSNGGFGGLHQKLLARLGEGSSA